MYVWRFSIAITLGFVWYFSDCGRTLTQYFICALFAFSTPLVFGNSGRESSTQTEEEIRQNPSKELCEDELLGDLTDRENSGQDEPPESQYPLVKRSLQQVFECAYACLLLPWYGVSEPCERQPLHQVLSRELDFLFDRIIERAKDFDVCQAAVGSIKILTQHLHNAKQPDREFLFTSRAEEIEVLREFSDALIRNLFHESFWGHEVIRCALNEIIALKGLGLLVTWLSNPDNLNQLVVSQLDSVTPRGSMEDLCGSDLDPISLALQEGDSEGSQVSSAGVRICNGTGIKTKVKDTNFSEPARKRKRTLVLQTTPCYKLKQGWSKFVDKMTVKKAKKKKMKEKEQELFLRISERRGAVFNGEDDGNGEGSDHSQQDSDEEDCDLESFLTSVQEDMMEFKLSYEMWRVGHWAVSIPHADWEDEELTFTLHLEEKESPENLHWDIKKTYMDVLHFRNRWQDSSLPTVLALEESEVKEEVKEEARLSVEHFLQELVSDEYIGHIQPVFQFLCPLDILLNEEEQHGGVWHILSGLAYFLTPGQEEEENCSPQTEAPKEIPAPSSQPKSTALPLEDSSASAGKGHAVTGPTVPTIVYSMFDSEPFQEAKTQKEPQSANDNSSDDKTEDSENPLTSHLKMIFKGMTRSRSQESLVSTRTAGDENPAESNSTPHSGQNGGLKGEGAESPFVHNLILRSNIKEKINFRLSGGGIKAKAKDQGTLPRREDCQKSQVNREQLEATKAIFDLLKEISGNSILINIFDAILKPVMPILKKKVNSFLNKMNPTEVQMATYIDTLRDRQWPESQPAPPPPSPRTDEEKNETKERAHNLITAKYSNSLVLKKTDMESVFNLFQDREENKTLVYMLLSFLLREFFPNEHSLHVSAAALQKVTNSTN